MEPLYQYVILHQSLRNTPGGACAQAIHAASESIRQLPVPDDTHAAVLMADTSDQLEQLAEKLMDHGIHYALICEPDEPYKGAAVALGVTPLPKARVQPLMVGLKAFR